MAGLVHLPGRGGCLIRPPPQRNPCPRGRRHVLVAVAGRGVEDVDPRELREESKDARRVRRAFKGRDDERRRTSAQAKKERRASKAEVERSQYGTQRATNVRSKGQPKLRRPKEHTPPPLVLLKRSDFKYLGKPPWVFTHECSLQRLHLPELAMENPPTEQQQGDAAEDERAADVAVDLEVTPAGSGFFLRGSISATVGRCCDMCGDGFAQRVDGPMSLWLTATENEFADDADDEMYWPESRNTIDLTGAVRDTVVLAVPTQARCARVDCAPDNERRWSLDDESSNDSTGNRVAAAAITRAIAQP